MTARQQVLEIIVLHLAAFMGAFALTCCLK